MTGTTAGAYRRLSLWLALVGLAAWALADVEIVTRSPGQALRQMLGGMLAPEFAATERLFDALLATLAFAFQGVALGVAAGFLLALGWQWRGIRLCSAVLRAVHELFWALIFLQITGLSTLTGVLAIAVPYAGIFAKVFGELLEEADRRPVQAVMPGNASLGLFVYARLPMVWPQMKSYMAYRLECGLRSSTILGFVGLPTLGFHLETALRQGEYGAGAALLYLFILVILTMRWWLRPPLVPLYLAAALVIAPPVSHGPEGALARFLGDLVPAPLRDGGGGQELLVWLADLLLKQGLPGLWQTLVLGTAALLATALLALALTPLVSRHFGNPLSRGLGHATLVTLRSLPEFLLAFVFLLILGPSMLPGILALGLHTGAILGHLLSRFAAPVRLRPDAPRGLSLYAWELLPRIYPNFLALLLYRWEIIMRETAILGLIGIPTLGFYIDSAFAEFRLDRALCLIGLAVILNLLVDALSRQCRRSLRLETGDPLP